jgi:hypothetical protein
MSKLLRTPEAGKPLDPVDIVQIVQALVSLAAEHIAERVVERLGGDLEFYDGDNNPIGTRRQFNAACRAAKFPAMKIGKRWVARREDVHKFLRELEARRTEPKVTPSGSGEPDLDGLLRGAGLRPGGGR